MDCPLTRGQSYCRRILGWVLDVLVVFFGTTGASGLFFAFRYEAVAASTRKVALGEVELEASTHLGLDIVDLGVSEKVCALRVGDDVYPVPMFDNVRSEERRVGKECR